MANVTISEREYAELKQSKNKLKEIQANKHVEEIIKDLEANRVQRVL